MVRGRQAAREPSLGWLPKPVQFRGPRQENHSEFLSQSILNRVMITPAIVSSIVSAPHSKSCLVLCASQLLGACVVSKVGENLEWIFPLNPLASCCERVHTIASIFVVEANLCCPFDGCLPGPDRGICQAHPHQAQGLASSGILAGPYRRDHQAEVSFCRITFR